MAVLPVPLLFVCGHLEIDRGRRELRVGGVDVELSGRAFEVLELLVRSGGNLVTKCNFMDAIWANTFVEENTNRIGLSGAP